MYSVVVFTIPFVVFEIYSIAVYEFLFPIVFIIIIIMLFSVFILSHNPLLPSYASDINGD